MIYVDINSPILSPHGVVIVLLLVALGFILTAVLQNMEKMKEKKIELLKISRQF